MTVRGGRPLRILVVHSSLLHRIFEASEVWQVVTAMLVSARAGEATISLTNCRQVWETELVDGQASLKAPRSMAAAWRDGFDVLHVHLAIPLRHLLWAALYRLRGVPVVFSPMALLGEDFAQASWFRGRHRAFRRIKPTLVRALALAWRTLASRVLCLSEYERRQTRIPHRKALFAPWPVPDTPLAASATAAGWGNGSRDPDGPLAVVSRFDPWRKGFDRLGAWALDHAEALPRPAVVLFVPPGDGVPPPLREALDRGLVEWDPDTRGADLLERLAGCRGAVLLSRWEAQPRALREAIVAGLPTISTPSCHLVEVVEILGCGAVVDGDDPRQMQAAFEAVAGQTARPGAVEALFGPPAQGRWMLDLLADVAARRRPAEPDYYRMTARAVPAQER